MPAESPYIVEFKHITKRFPKVIANDDISLQIRQGEIFALLGENGAGKSTLMSILFGLYEPDEGEIFIRGNKETISNPNHATRLNIGMVHQHFRLVQNQSITENIILGIEPIKRKLGIFSTIDMHSAEKEILQLSRQYGLKVDPTQKIGDVTVSVRQRVEILKMLYRNAEILIFDEPTALLTPQEIDSLLQIIRSLRDGGKTIILISHKLEEIKQVADRCAVLCKGKLEGVLDVATTTTLQMANMMVGRDVLFSLEKEEPAFGKEILQVSGLDVILPNGFAAVKGASFTVHEGEIFAIAGVSGNGQMELTDAIAGMIESSGGSVLLDGVDMTHMGIRKRTEQGIAYIPEDRQEVGLILDFTLAQNLALKRYYQMPFCKNGILQMDAFASIGEELIGRYDIRSGEGVKAQARSMSGGNQQKAIIAREIELDSKLLVFVQPTRGLDIGAIEDIHEKILALRSQGKAILLVSLELDEIMSLSDTIGVMYNGKLQHIYPASSLSANQVGEYMMGVK